MPIVPGINYDKIVPIKIKDDQAIRSIYLAWNDTINTNSTVRDFRDFILDLYDIEKHI